ncbi:MAG: hypothetical protein ABIM89_17520, partial [Mycobacteriales bacterium]
MLVTTALVVSNNVVLSITLSRLGYDVLEARPRDSEWLSRCAASDVVLLDLGAADRATGALELVRRTHELLPVVVLANDHSEWSEIPDTDPATLFMRERITPAALESALEAALRQVNRDIKPPPAAAAGAEVPVVSPVVALIAAPDQGASSMPTVPLVTPVLRLSEAAFPAQQAPEATPDLSRLPVTSGGNGVRSSDLQALERTWLVVTDDAAVDDAFGATGHAVTVAALGHRWLDLLPRARGVVLDFPDADTVFGAVRNIRRAGFRGPVQALWEDSTGRRGPKRVVARRLAVAALPVLLDRLISGDVVGHADVPPPRHAVRPARTPGTGSRTSADPPMRVVVVSAEPSLTVAFRRAGIDAASAHANDRRLFSGDPPDALVLDVSRFVVDRSTLARLHAQAHELPVLVAGRDGSLQSHEGLGNGMSHLGPVPAAYPPAVADFPPPGRAVPAVIDLVERGGGPSVFRVAVPALPGKKVGEIGDVDPRPSRRRLLPTRSAATSPVAPAPTVVDPEAEVLAHALEAVATFVSLTDVATAVVTEACEVARADAVALLVREDDEWIVETGVALRLREQRQALARDAWIIQQAVERQLAIVIDDSDQTRWQL